MPFFHRSRTIQGMLCPTWDVERDASAVTLAVPTRAELGDDAAANRGGAASVTDASSSSAAPPPTLTIDVFDEDAGGQRSHDHLGRVYVPWSTLVARSDVVTLPLVHADQSGSKCTQGVVHSIRPRLRLLFRRRSRHVFRAVSTTDQNKDERMPPSMRIARRASFAQRIQRTTLRDRSIGQRESPPRPLTATLRDTLRDRSDS